MDLPRFLLRILRLSSDLGAGVFSNLAASAIDRGGAREAAICLSVAAVLTAVRSSAEGWLDSGAQQDAEEALKVLVVRYGSLRAALEAVAQRTAQTEALSAERAGELLSLLSADTEDPAGLSSQHIEILFQMVRWLEDWRDQNLAQFEELRHLIERTASLDAERHGEAMGVLRRIEEQTAFTTARSFDPFGPKDVSPSDRWSSIAERCRRLTRRKAELLGYRPEWDVRQPFADDMARGVAAAAFLVITGESGHGKSWRLYAAGSTAPFATTLLRASGDSEADLRRAADDVWQSVLGHPETCPLPRLAELRAEVFGRSAAEPWLTVCMDGLDQAREAKDLLATPVEAWGIQVVIACDPYVGEVFEQHARQQPNRVRLIRAGRFTPGERDEYLRRRLSDGWAVIPADVRDLLCTPQLAHLYGDLAGQLGGWQPRNEYELVAKYWGRLAGSDNAGNPRDELRLRRLAATVLHGTAYPWDREVLEEVGIDDAAERRIINLGWLRLNADGRYEVPHDRLLSFAVAKHLAARGRSSGSDVSGAAELLGQIWNGIGQFAHGRLDYVLMDWFYLASRDDMNRASAVLALLEDRLQHHDRETLHRKLLPTLEAAAVPLLLDRLVALAQAGRWWELEAIIDGLAIRPAAEVRDRVLGLVTDERPRVQRAGLKLLSSIPVPEALDAAWRLHVEMQADPRPFMEDDPPHAQLRGHLLYKESFAALRECTRLRPDWIVMAVRTADPEKEPVQDLAYLVANLADGSEIWRTCKAELFAKVPAGRRRALALNIGTWRDMAEADWLDALAGIEQDHLGPAAVRALTQVAPRRAAAALKRLPEPLLYFCRSWYLPRLFLHSASETREHLYQRIQGAEDPFRTAQVYQGNENEMDARTLELLLDLLDDRLGRLLPDDAESSNAGGVERPRSDALDLPLNLLAAVGRRDLLDVFAARRGSRLERRLTRWLVSAIGPRRDIGQDNRSRGPTFGLLLRIGGSGYCEAVNAFLDADSQYGRLDALKAAVKGGNHETIRKLRRAALSDELWDERVPLLQLEAVRALGALGDGTGVLMAALKLGLKMPTDMEEWLPPGCMADEVVIEEAERVIRDRDLSRLPGALIGLGLLKHVAVAEDIMALIREPPNSDVQLAAIIGLRGVAQAVLPAHAVVAACLHDQGLRHSTVGTLSQMNTEGARWLLLESLDRKWDPEIAVWLTQFPDTREGAMGRLADRLRSPDRWPRTVWHSVSEELLARAGDEVLGEIFRRCPEFGDHVREAAFAADAGGWVVGTKSDAIRGLATLDARAAFLAARKALEDTDARDRHLYPPLLYRLDSSSARELFLDEVADESNEAVIWSMSHTLGEADADWLARNFSDSLPARRLAACRLAGGAALKGGHLLDQLIRLLDDRIGSVADAAEDALHLSRCHRWSEELAEVFERSGADDRDRGWVLVDAALQVSDVGFRGVPWPAWAQRMADSRVAESQPALRQVLAEQLTRVRKKALERAEQESRRNH